MSPFFTGLLVGLFIGVFVGVILFAVWREEVMKITLDWLKRSIYRRYRDIRLSYWLS